MCYSLTVVPGSAGIKNAEDLHDKTLFCAIIDTDMSILQDATALKDVLGIKPMLSAQNNRDYYGRQLLEHPERIGLMLPSVAQYYRFQSEKKLVELIFEQPKQAAL